MAAGLMIPLLGATDPAEVLNAGATATRNATRLHMTDLLIVIAICLLLLTALVVWAVFIRKPKADGTRVRINKHREQVEEREDGTIRKRKRRRKQRRAHRERNPTLSEVGGLPPPRTDGAPPAL